MSRSEKPTVFLHNIPSMWSSYYILGLNKVAKLVYQPLKDFQKYDNKQAILTINNKKIILDHYDPHDIDHSLYNYSDLYFMNNKNKNNENLLKDKVIPLFPHYPINNINQYLRHIFNNFNAVLKTETFKNLYTQYKRPFFIDHDIKHYTHQPYIFFVSRIWAKEKETNQLRAAFISAAMRNPQITFEGGLKPRKDGQNQNLDPYFTKKVYPASQFLTKCRRSLVNLNNPAVRGAVSWRLAEQLNGCCFVLTLPFDVVFPVMPKHGEHIHYIQSQDDFDEVIEMAFNNPDYHKKIAMGGKKYFETYCSPIAQANYILSLC